MAPSSRSALNSLRRSPDGAERNPGIPGKPARCSLITLRFIRATKEIREAERRQTRIQPSASFRMRQRAQRSTLACRRSTAVLTDGLSPVSRDFRPGFLGRGESVRSCAPAPTGGRRPSAVISGRYPPSPIPVQWQHPTGRSYAGLLDARSRPGAECVVPPAGTALAPHNREHPRDGVPYRARFAMTCN